MLGNKEMKLPKIANYRPIAIGAITLAGGIALAALTLSSAIGFFICLAVLVIALVASIIIKRGAFKVASLFMLLGFLLFSSYAFVNEVETLSYTSVYVEARICEVSRATGETKRYVVSELKLDDEVLRGKALLDTGAEHDVGDVVGAVVKLESIAFDPFDTYSVSRYEKGIKYSLSAVHSAKIGEDKLSLTERVRAKLRDIYIGYLGEEDGGIALGLVIGDTSYIDYDTRAEMSVSGLTHLFSVSGLHIGFMCALVFGLFRLFGVGRRRSFYIAVGVLLAYGLLTGFPIGALRAIIMCIAVLIAERKEERSDPMNTLSVCVIIMLLFSPVELFSLSFQMSVGAVFGILCFYAPLKHWYKGKSRFIKKLWSAVSVSVAANAFVLPISAYSFGSISIYFIFANLIAVPLTSLVYTLLVPLSLFALIFEPLGILITPLGIPITATRLIATAISVLPGAMVELTIPCAAALAFSIGLAALSKYYLGSKSSKIAISASFFIACALIIFII